MRYGSICSGIEAASVAWHPLGWRPAFFAEIDPFPCAVLNYRYPHVPNWGDFTIIPRSAGPVDVLVGGTPCQGFSVAGLRKGLADDRSNLALEFLRLAGRLRPVWLVWENVPGVLSTNGGRDFGSFLGGLGELGYGWAYRILDAQYFGVPQRRRRVFVVGYLGDWRRAAAVLFDRHSLSGHPAPRRQTQSGVAPSVTPGARRASGARSGEQLTVARSLTAAGQRLDGDSDNFVAAAMTTRPYGDHEARESHLIAHTLRADGFDASEDGTGRGTRSVCEWATDALQASPTSNPAVAIPIDMRQASRGETMTNNRPEGSSGGAPGTGVGEPGDPAPSISLSHPPAIAYQCHGNNVGPMGTIRSGNAGLTGGVPFIVNAAESCAKQSHARPSEVARCLDSTGSFANAQGGTVVGVIKGAAIGRRPDCGPQYGETLTDGTVYTLNCTEQHAIAASMAVRRLTPRECERLQGFPDDYTLIPVKPVPAKSQAKSRARYEAGDERFTEINGVMYFVSADGPRYKALGNSMAVPVMRWIGERIQMVETIPITPEEQDRFRAIVGAMVDEDADN